MVGRSALEFTEMLVDYFSDGQVDASNVRKYQTVLSCCSEAEFPEFGPPRAAVVGMVGERGKQYCTETLSRCI